jgi:hypothetical protein
LQKVIFKCGGANEKPEIASRKEKYHTNRQAGSQKLAKPAIVGFLLTIWAVHGLAVLFCSGFPEEASPL